MNRLESVKEGPFLEGLKNRLIKATTTMKRVRDYLSEDLEREESNLTTLNYYLHSIGQSVQILKHIRALNLTQRTYVSKSKERNKSNKQASSKCSSVSPPKLYKSKEEPEGRPLSEVFSNYNFGHSRKSLLWSRPVSEAVSSDHQASIRTIEKPNTNIYASGLGGKDKKDQKDSGSKIQGLLPRSGLARTGGGLGRRERPGLTNRSAEMVESGESLASQAHESKFGGLGMADILRIKQNRRHTAEDFINIEGGISNRKSDRYGTKRDQLARLVDGDVDPRLHYLSNNRSQSNFIPATSSHQSSKEKLPRNLRNRNSGDFGKSYYMNSMVGNLTTRSAFKPVKEPQTNNSSLLRHIYGSQRNHDSRSIQNTFRDLEFLNTEIQPSNPAPSKGYLNQGYGNTKKGISLDPEYSSNMVAFKKSLNSGGGKKKSINRDQLKKTIDKLIEVKEQELESRHSLLAKKPKTKSVSQLDRIAMACSAFNPKRSIADQRPSQISSIPGSLLSTSNPQKKTHKLSLSHMHSLQGSQGPPSNFSSAVKKPNQVNQISAQALSALCQIIKESKEDLAR